MKQLKENKMRKLILATAALLSTSVNASISQTDIENTKPVPMISTALDKNVIEILPQELHMHTIFQTDSIQDFRSLSCVSTYWNKITKEVIQGSIVVVGNTGNGKSSLVHLLAGKNLYAKKLPNYGTLLEAEEKLPNINISHGARVGTLEPSYVMDFLHKRIIVDCPGFLDTRGNKQNYINAVSIHKNLKGNFKVMLVTNSAKILGPTKGMCIISQLNTMTEIFPDQDQLKKALYLVASGEENGYDCAKKLKLLVKAGKPTYLSERGYDLINFLIENPNHLADFPAPTRIETDEGIGTYELVGNMKDLIKNNDFVSNPVVNAPRKETIESRDTLRWCSEYGYDESGDQNKYY